MRSFLHKIGVFCTVTACILLTSSSAKATDISAHASGSPPQASLTVQEPGNPALESGIADDGTDEGTGQSHTIPITSYRQNDPAWADYLYGGQDPMSTYGCGPTALAIAAATLTGTQITPVGTAEWAAANGYFSPQNGSVHSLIPDGGRNYGLTVEVVNILTPESFCMALSMDKLLILLMGPGDFSDSGHFIVAYGYDSNGDILVADPASGERSLTHWPAGTLIGQLSKTAKNGGPVWALSKQ